MSADAITPVLEELLPQAAHFSVQFSVHLHIKSKSFCGLTHLNQLVLKYLLIISNVARMNYENKSTHHLPSGPCSSHLVLQKDGFCVCVCVWCMSS
jgi:hypothetical protein